VNTDFVVLSALFDVSVLAPAQLMHLELLLEALFELPLTHADGTALTHEDVVAGLARDTMDQITSMGKRNWRGSMCLCVFLSVFNR
jgi:hypothetical protein